MIKSFIEYIKNPVSTESLERFTFKIYFKTIGLSYLLVFLSSVFLVIYKQFVTLPNYQQPQGYSIKILLFVVVIGPLIEEILCRLILKVSKLNMAAFVAVLIVIIIKMLFFRGFHPYLYLVSAPLFVFIYYLINRFDFSVLKIETFVKSKFKYFFHFFAIAFGLMHLTNYAAINWWMVAVSPLLTASLISLGYLLGFVRMKYGFKNAWLIHSTFNLIYMIISITKHWV